MSIVGSQTITVDGVTATIDIVLDEHAVLAYLGPRAMRNRSGRATISKNIPSGRASLLIAEVRKASKHQSPKNSTSTQRTLATNRARRSDGFHVAQPRQRGEHESRARPCIREGAELVGSRERTAGARMSSKRYLGDSVYADFDGYHIVLTTENGYGPSNTICLEPMVVRELRQYVSDQFARVRDEESSDYAPDGEFARQSSSEPRAQDRPCSCLPGKCLAASELGVDPCESASDSEAKR